MPLVSKIKKFWQNHEPKIVALLGFILVSTLAFEAGVLKGQKAPESPLVIEKAALVQNQTSPPKNENASNSEPEAKNSETPTEKKNCAFVGSKNSNKYHLPTCRWAKSIKPENRVCFSSEDDAKSKGYQPDSNCIK